MEELLGVLTYEMSMLVKEGQSYRFLHQDFRDFFAAVHILNEVAMGLSQDEVAEVLTGGMISFYPRRFMGEIEGEHYCKPYLEEGKGWQIKSNESALLAMVLKKCRGNFDDPYAYAVANILESWKQLRGEWSGLDLSRLDLSKVLINGTVCSRLYKNKYLAPRFDESLIPTKSLFHAGHKDWVLSAVYSGDGQKILSASDDNTIKEWDVASGTCLRTYHGYQGKLHRLVYSADGQKILASAYGEDIVWDVETGRSLGSWEDGIDARFDDFPDFADNKTFENRLIKTNKITGEKIKIIDRQTQQIIHTIENIPGLFIQGCSFKNLHPDSHLTEEEKQFLKMYGGTVE